jgi:hypothetical protein
MCRFWAQYWIIATPREASGPASGGSMMIVAGGSLPVSGITEAGGQMSVAFCAIAVIAYNTMAATDSRDVHFELVCFRLAICFPPARSPKSNLSPEIDVAADGVKRISKVMVDSLFFAADFIASPAMSASEQKRGSETIGRWYWRYLSIG